METSLKKRPSVGNPLPSMPRAQTRNSFVVDKGRWAISKRAKPVQDPITVGDFFTKVILKFYFLRKILFIEAKYRLTAYAVLLFFVSLVTDYISFPKTYLAYSNNFPNTYFVKYSWGWTMLSTGAFIYLTTTAYCCGNRQQILRHMARLAIATAVWFVWTRIFRAVDKATGQCIPKDQALISLKGRLSCVSKGGNWKSFDISGHAFLLIWCVLFTAEESKAIVGWDRIKDFIRHEDHNRRRGISEASPGSFEETPLKALTDEEFDRLKYHYTKKDVIAKVSLIWLAVLTLIWDLMVIATAVYFHVMIEKVIGGLIAALMWFITYRGFYLMEVSPGLPGSGLFKYNDVKPSSAAAPVVTKQRSFGKPSTSGGKPKGKELPDDIPKFMGMPPLKKKDDLEMDEWDFFSYSN